MKKFTEGEKVIAVQEINDMLTTVPRGAVGTFVGYGSTQTNSGYLGSVAFPGYSGDGKDGSVKTWDKELEHYIKEPTKPKWADVEPGDKVVFWDTPTDTEYTATATTRYGSNSVLVLGAYTGSIVTLDTRELISIEKPRPTLPTTPGSVVRSNAPDDLGQAHVILTHDRKWMGASVFGVDPDLWVDGWTVVHDAGKKNDA